MQLVITKYKDAILSSLFDGLELVQVHVEQERSNSLIGNVYVGKVKNIVKNINAAFVEIADGQMCYLAMNEKETPVFVNPKNNNRICIGDELLVQISKDAIKTKNPSVTTKLQFAGKYIVLTHGDCRVSVSGKIKDVAVREQLQSLVAEYAGEECGCGMILRTNAAGASEEEIKQEASRLYELYRTICTNGLHRTVFSLLYEAPKGYLSDIRDGYDTEIEKIMTDDVEIYHTIKQHMELYQAEDVGKLQLYQDEMLSLDALYGVETKIKKALSEKVWLKSGGYLVIQPTEALTVVDVNTGKAIAGKKAVDTHFLKINMEAAREIAKQIRLRNLSGIIIVDFIDLDSKEAKRQLITCLEQEIVKDPIKTNFIDMTKLNLVELTRKKVRKPLHEQWRGLE